MYRRFYLSFKDIEITNARVRNLTWTHLRIIMREATPEGRLWYLKEASEQMWSTRPLERNVTTQYYGRMMASQRASISLQEPTIEEAETLLLGSAWRGVGKKPCTNLVRVIGACHCDSRF